MSRRGLGNGGNFGALFILICLYVIFSTIKFIITYPAILIIPAVPALIFLIHLILKKYIEPEKANIITYLISVVVVFCFCSAFFITSVTDLSFVVSLIMSFSPIACVLLVIVLKKAIKLLEKNNIYIFKSLIIKRYKDKLFLPHEIPNEKDFPGVYLILNDCKNILYVGHTNDANSLSEARNQFLLMNTDNCIFEDFKYGKNKFLVCFLPFKNRSYDNNCLEAKKLIINEEIEHICCVCRTDIELFNDIISVPPKEKLSSIEIEKILNKIDRRYAELTELNDAFEMLNIRRRSNVERISYCANSKHDFDRFDYRIHINEKIQSNINKYMKIVDAEKEFADRWPEYLLKYSALPEPLTYKELDKNNISIAKYSKILPQKIEPDEKSFKIILNVYYTTPAGRNRYENYFVIDIDEIADFVNGKVIIEKKKYNTTISKNKKDLDLWSITDKWFTFETVEYYRQKYNDFDGIYVLCNNTKKKYYVGQSVNVFHRIHSHFTNGGCKEAYYDFLSGNKFTIRLMPLAISNFDNLDEYERAMIAYYNAYYKGYNKTRGNHGYYKSFYRQRAL